MCSRRSTRHSSRRRRTRAASADEPLQPAGRRGLAKRRWPRSTPRGRMSTTRRWRACATRGELSSSRSPAPGRRGGPSTSAKPSSRRPRGRPRCRPALASAQQRETLTPAPSRRSSRPSAGPMTRGRAPRRVIGQLVESVRRDRRRQRRAHGKYEASLPIIQQQFKNDLATNFATARGRRNARSPRGRCRRTCSSPSSTSRPRRRRRRPGSVNRISSAGDCIRLQQWQREDAGERASRRSGARRV